MKQASFNAPTRLAKGLLSVSAIVGMLGCGPGGSVPGAVGLPTPRVAAVNVCAGVITEPVNDGLPAPVLGAVGDWVLQPDMSDEFDGNAVDTTKWEFQIGTGASEGLEDWGNQELQYYRAENATVDGQNLTIAGKRENFRGKPYTSARLRTKDKIDFTYGRVEARIQTPAGRGFWPAFWMLSSNSPYGDTWAATGEIDIFETFNPGIADIDFSYEKLKGTLWHGFVFPNQLSRGGQVIGDPTEWHTYAVEWEANEIRWYADGVHFQTIGADHFRSYYWGGQDTGYVKPAPGAPFDVDFHILLNLAIGGTGPAAEPDGATVFPANMLVDYVRVYKCEIDGVESETGGGCASNVEPTVEKAPVADVFVDSRTLFGETVNDLVYCSGDQPVVRDISLAVLDDTGALTMSETAATVDSETYGTVLDITIDSPSDFVGIAFEAADSGTFALVGMGDSANANGNAEIKMDIYIDSANTDQAGTLGIFMEDSAAAAAANQNDVCADDGVETKEFNIADLPQDQWTTLSVQLNELVTGLNVEEITKLFGLVVDSNAHIQVDNVAVVCGHPTNNACGIQPPSAGDVFDDILNVYIDDVDPIWSNNIGAWDPDFGSDYFDGTAGRHVQWRDVETGEVGHDTVVEVSFTTSAPNGVWFIQSGIGLDLTSFLEGKLVFDLKLIAGNPTGFTYKIDCRFPCGTGDQILQGFDLGSGDWQTFEIIVADLVAAGLDITKVNTGIVLLPNVGSQQGVTFQLDNVRWEKFGGEPPPPPPPEGSQPPTLPPPGSLVMYQDTTEDLWQLWDCCGAGTLIETAATDPEHGAAYGMVTQISYGPGGTVSGYSYGNAGDGGVVLDASAFAGGSLEFDALIVSQPDSCAPWRFKVEARDPVTPIELPLSAGHGGIDKPPGQWAHYSFPFEGLLGGFNTEAFKLFMAFPVFFQADGAVIQLDNVHIAPAPAP